jgi:hypothetical protein
VTSTKKKIRGKMAKPTQMHFHEFPPPSQIFSTIIVSFSLPFSTCEHNLFQGGPWGLPNAMQSFIIISPSLRHGTTFSMVGQYALKDPKTPTTYVSCLNWHSLALLETSLACMCIEKGCKKWTPLQELKPKSNHSFHLKQPFKELILIP